MARKIRTYSNDEALVRERRGHIAQCAIKVFFEKGYKATTMRELAKVCGMAQGALYHYIGSKTDILHLICVNLAGGATQLIRLLNELGDVSKTEALRECIKEYFRRQDAEQQSVIFFNREIANFTRDDRRMLLESQVDVQRVFEKLLIAGINADEFIVDNPTLVAHNILMHGQDWAMRRWFLRGRFTLAEYTEKQTEFILKAIRTDSNQTTENEEAKGIKSKTAR